MSEKEYNNESIFSDKVSDIKISKKSKERNLEDELFGKKGIQEKIDALEEHLGFSNPTKEKKRNIKYYTRLFNPSRDEDEALLSQLLNDKDQFHIIMWKDTWTVHGDYKVFIIYSEDLDLKKEKKDKKDESEPDE